MISSKTEKLIVKYLCNQASIIELDELESWILKSQKNEKLFNSYIKTNYVIEFNTKKFNTKKVKLKLLETIKKEQRDLKLRRIRKIISYSAAAAISGLLITSIVFKEDFFSISKTNSQQEVVNTNIVVPGSDKAILTLEDGSFIELNKENTFKNEQANSNGEQIVYKRTIQKTTKIKYNSLTIPRGGQFYLKLADGTSVWLNSESKLRYPVSFTDGETRKVELIYGEAYFDVSPSTKHKGAKFMVSNQFQDIEVLGTKFNLQAYKDEANIYTTLVEGKVSVNIGDSKQTLLPSEQSNLNKNNNDISVNLVDVKSVISWKNGFFSFRGKPLKDIAKILSRWYDVDIIFENKELEEITFKGVLGKDQMIEDILLSIKTLSIIKDYSINENKITIK
ncbi:FecR family protein [uncultured Maribacter sp.]|uniref:FecR family protein n=1 Tax=uncultured Maribacter sp. TaxID=431308 RepID=UPI002627C784|nr:FecR family protein [uncultured Maribacter sp.]